MVVDTSLLPLRLRIMEIGYILEMNFSQFYSISDFCLNILKSKQLTISPRGSFLFLGLDFLSASAPPPAASVSSEVGGGAAASGGLGITMLGHPSFFHRIQISSLSVKTKIFSCKSN